MTMRTKNISPVIALVRALSSLDKNFPLPYAVFLLEVARNEGCSLTDLQKATGMPLPTLSRILWALSTKRQTGAEPYADRAGLSSDNGRRKGDRLSAKGRKFISRVSAILDQARPESGNARQFSLAAEMWPDRRNR